MHTQTAGPEHRAAFAPSLQTATGLGLYLLTLAGEVMLGAGVRGLLTYIGALALGGSILPGLGPDQLAWLAALGPLAWSLSALLAPGGGFLWRRRRGARRPTADELLAIEDGIRLLEAAGAASLDRRDIYILDDPLPLAFAYGRIVVLSRGLIDSDDLPAALAHELGHLASLDGRLTEALDRMVLWGGASCETGRSTDRQQVAPPPGGLLLTAARWTLRLAGGSCTQRMLRPLWSAYWRRREYAADAHAVRLGQAADLARHLQAFQLAFDPPRDRLLDTTEHPPVALRIDRLLAGVGGPK
jgi:Zn-dependent protease with chaperone function